MAKRQRINYQAPYNSANYYNNSSSAVEQLLEEFVPEQKPVKLRKTKRGTKTITEDATDKSARPSLLIFVAMFFVAIGAVLSLLANSFVVVQSRENNSLRSELHTMQTRTGELNAQAAQSVDLEEVERIARARLGMSEPQIHQIRYINMPRQDFTLHLPEISDEEISYNLSKSPSFLSLLNIFARD